MKSYRLFAILLALILLPAFSGCEKQDSEDIPGDPVIIELSSVEKSLAETSNEFSFDIFKLLMDGDSETENIMISPLSISYALSMTLNGAAGATRDSMLKALRNYDLTVDEINSSYSLLSKKLTTVDERVIMSIANSVWVEDRLVVKQEFLDALVNFFNAEGRQFNINDPGIVDEVNRWISDNTNGKIEEMIDEIPQDVVMLLINAIYFNGKWRYKFDESSTNKQPFYTEPGNSVDVDMMNIETNYKVMQNGNLTIAEMPYGQGNFVMDIILPAEGKTTEDILPIINSENWDMWMATLTEREVNLFMPRFKYEYKIELREVLTAMGMGIAFSGNADFSNIADVDLAISKVLHQTFIDNKEEGTEAAAATVVMIELTSVGPSQPLTIRLDRPFYYLIREVSTNTILFMGMTGNPASE